MQVTALVIAGVALGAMAVVTLLAGTAAVASVVYLLRLRRTMLAAAAEARTDMLAELDANMRAIRDELASDMELRTRLTEAFRQPTRHLHAIGDTHAS